MRISIRICLNLAAFLFSMAVYGQSQEALIQLELINYETRESKSQIEGEGELKEGLPNGEWVYYLIYDRSIIYRKGNYINGKKEGVWNNYAILPPMGYTDNYDLVRSSETYKDGKLFRYKMGQDNLLITIENGLEESYITELQRLDEAFENSYRRTHGKTITPEFGESVESLQSRVVPMFRTELLKSKQKAELKFWSLYHKLKLYEAYDSGKIVKKLIQQWEKDILYSKEVYENEKMKEKYVYIEGEASNFIESQYYDTGSLNYSRQYINDSIPTGRWIEYYPNGEKKSIGSYIHGKREGKWKFWTESGEMKLIKYKNGIEN